jgi:hypothetical protein
VAFIKYVFCGLRLLLLILGRVGDRIGWKLLNQESLTCVRLSTSIGFNSLRSSERQRSNVPEVGVSEFLCLRR